MLVDESFVAAVDAMSAEQLAEAAYEGTRKL